MAVLPLLGLGCPKYALSRLTASSSLASVLQKQNLTRWWGAGSDTQKALTYRTMCLTIACR